MSSAHHLSVPSESMTDGADHEPDPFPDLGGTRRYSRAAGGYIWQYVIRDTAAAMVAYYRATERFETAQLRWSS